MSEMKTFYLKTFGCQMNIYDSHRVYDLMQSNGYSFVDNPVDADVVILNTCYIREKASEKIFSELGRIKVAKKHSGKFDNFVVAVIGCVAKAEENNIFDRVPYVNIVLSPSKYHLLPEKISIAFNNPDEKIIDVGLNGVEKFDYLTDISLSSLSDYSAFISVQEGCDKFCTYCVVPYTRGREVSRPFEDVIEEAKKLDNGKTIEITLLGQNVSAYNGKDASGNQRCLADLIEEIAKFDFVKRIRYITSYPTQLGDRLIKLHSTEKKLQPLLFVPIQSGSDNVLKKMNRRYNQQQYKQMIDDVLSVFPDAKFSSDFIVGFPGETDDDFKQTLKIVDEVEFINSFSFKYSPRPHTPAQKMDNQVPEDVKTKRLIELQKLLSDKQLAFNKSLIGKVIPVLFESVAKKEKNSMFGKSEFMQTVIADYNENCIGKIVDVKILEADAFTLKGELIEKK